MFVGWCGARFKHVVLPTFVLASLLVVLDRGGYLEAVKSLTTRIVAVLTAGEGLQFSTAERAPLVVTIGDDVFDQHFGGESPLNRDRLANLIRRVIDTYKPQMLAIDLDLSPGSEGFRRGDKPRLIDQTLCKAALADAVPCDIGYVREDPPHTKGCRTLITLIEPFGFANDEGSRTDGFWKRAMEEWLGRCIRFASGEVQTHGASALFYDEDHDGLGRVTYRLTEECSRPIAPEAEMADCPEEFDARKIATLESGNPRRRLIRFDFLDHVRNEAGARGGSTTLLLPVRMRKGKQEPELVLQPQPDRCKNCVVFLGGSWGVEDKHYTALSTPVDGVVVHAAIYYSDVSATRSEHAGDFLADVVFGLIFGAIFGWVWEKHVLAGLALHDWPASLLLPPGNERRYATLVPYHLYWLLAMAILIGAFALAIWLSKLLLVFGWWANLAGMIVGLTIHSIIESRGIREAHTIAIAAATLRNGGGCRRQEPEVSEPWRATVIVGSAIWATRLLAFIALIGTTLAILTHLI